MDSQGQGGESVDLSDLPEAAKDALEPIAFSKDVFYVEAELWLGAVKFPRSMIIVRTNGELALINAIRLREEIEAKIRALGEIRHVIRPGCHEQDVAYYVRKFGAKVTGFSHHKFEHGVRVDRDIAQDGLPFAVDQLLILDGLPRRCTEANFVLATENGRVLVTCDSVQNWVNARTNWLGRIALPWYGFSGKCIFDKYWVDDMKKKDGASEKMLADEFRKVLALDFDNLLSGHGCIMDGSAKQASMQSFHRLFGSD